MSSCPHRKSRSVRIGRRLLALALTMKALNGPITQLSQLEPARFFAGPNLWLGLAFAAAFIYAAVRLRRSREPT